MTWTHLPLGNKTSRFMQSALALMIAGTLPAYAGTFNPRFLEDVPGIDQHVDLSMYESNKAEHLPGKYRVSVVVNEKKWSLAPWSLRQRQRRSAQKWVNPWCRA